MIETLTHAYSPLAQARRQSRVAMTGSDRQPSQQDQATLKRILTGKCEYMPNALFEEFDAYQAIIEEAPPIARPNTSWYHAVMEGPADSRTLSHDGIVRLTAAQERTLFLQFNYCRYRVAQCQLNLDPSALDAGLAHQALAWHHKAEAYRGLIAQFNLGLVLAMAKRLRLSKVEFSELVSEGNMALLRAADKFDVARGFKFSTYACRSILKSFSRLAGKLTRHRQIFPADFNTKFERSDYMERKRATHEEDCVDEIRLILGENQADLSEIEREVIRHRFGVGKTNEDGTRAGPLTLEEVGKIIGVTKERVRQIQNKALERIRLTLEEGFLS